MRLNFRLLDLKLAYHWRIARKSSSVSQVLILKLEDSNGLHGWGEAAPITRYQESVETASAFFQKIDPLVLSFQNIESSMLYVNGLSPDNKAAKCAVNIALLDGAAKYNQKTVSQFLNVPFQESTHVTSFTLGIDTPEIIRRKAIAAEAYPVLKMKVGVPEDKANLKALREIAPDKPIRVDANEAWTTKEQALNMIEWLANDKKIEFVEQPMPAVTPTADWIWLKQKSPLPIFADESYHQAEDARRVAECFHGVNVKLVKAGGISGAMEALKAARQVGLKTMLGCMIETSILISAAAHLAGLCDFLDLDGNLLITNDPYVGVTTDRGILSFADAPEKFGLRVSSRT